MGEESETVDDRLCDHRTRRTGACFMLVFYLFVVID